MDIKIVMESVDYIKSKLNFQPEIGVILGSGLGDMADTVEERTVIKYSEVPNLPVSTVQGHAGQFVVGKLNGKNVIMMQGRFHYYEGYDISTLALPIYIMKNLGVESLIVTNAAGGNSPLIGKNDDKIGPRFPDMSEAYSKDYIKLAHEVSSELNLKLQEGVYMMFSGPTYETPSEVRMARILGADAVGMSTVPEVIAARHCGIKTLGISCITNMAAGILDQPLNHNEVIETSAKVKSQFVKLVKEIIARM